MLAPLAGDPVDQRGDQRIFRRIVEALLEVGRADLWVALGGISACKMKDLATARPLSTFNRLTALP